MLTFQRIVLRSLRKTFLGPKAEFSKGFVYISKRGESAYIFTQVFYNKGSKEKEGKEISSLIFNWEK